MERILRWLVDMEPSCAASRSLSEEDPDMKSILLVAAMLSAGLAGATVSFAQDNTTTSSTGDPADYLKAENIQDFYTDANLKTMKAAEEIKKVYTAMTPDEQARMKAACAANQESKFADLCKNIESM
jgi:hypothetical protein